LSDEFLQAKEDSVIDGGDQFFTSRIQRKSSEQHRTIPCEAVKSGQLKELLPPQENNPSLCEIQKVTVKFLRFASYLL
jgi:hypothetical protein